MQISFHPASNLNNILCNIKSKFIPNSYSGLYQLGCNCGLFIYLFINTVFIVDKQT